MNTFESTIQKARIKKSFSLRELAEKVGLSFTYISDIENDKIILKKDETLKDLSEVLNLSYEELINLPNGDIIKQIAEGKLSDNQKTELLKIISIKINNKDKIC